MKKLSLYEIYSAAFFYFYDQSCKGTNSATKEHYRNYYSQVEEAMKKLPKQIKDNKIGALYVLAYQANKQFPDSNIPMFVFANIDAEEQEIIDFLSFKLHQREDEKFIESLASNWEISLKRLHEFRLAQSY